MARNLRGEVAMAAIRQEGTMSRAERLKLIARPHSQLSIKTQYALLNVQRSSLYYKAKPVSDEDLALIKRIDTIRLSTRSI